LRDVDCQGGKSDDADPDKRALGYDKSSQQGGRRNQRNLSSVDSVCFFSLFHHLFASIGL
jgi:hypothetical protein